MAQNAHTTRQMTACRRRKHLSLKNEGESGRARPAGGCLAAPALVDETVLIRDSRHPVAPVGLLDLGLGGGLAPLHHISLERR